MEEYNDIFELTNILSLTEIRVYLFLKKLSPKIISGQKLGLIGRGETQSIDEQDEKNYGYCLVSRIRKKLGKDHGIKSERGSGYYYQAERKEEN